MIHETITVIPVFIPKGIIKYPERAIRVSKSIAMKSLVPLTMRGCDIYNEPHARATKLWAQAREESKTRREKSDNTHFIPICDIEKPLRKNHLDMVFNTTAFYGNTEVKRVYAWREGTIGPLNTLLNIAGARLRFLGMTRFPFPRPTRKLIEHINKDGNSYYQEHSTYGATKDKITVILSHPFLPELDFVDMLRGHLPPFIRSVFERLREEFKEIKKKQLRKKSIHFPRMLFELKGPKKIQPRLAIVTLPFKVPKNVTPDILFPSPIPLQEVFTLNPFAHRNEDSLHFILYVSVSTHGSPGDSAARIARNYHALDFAYSSAKKYGCRRIGWLDLAGEFTDKSHRPVILRLNGRSANAQIIYDDIDFIDLSEMIEDTLFKGEQIPSVESLEQILADEPYDLILVSGIETIRSLTPQRMKGVDDTLISHIAEAIPSSVKCLIWFDSPASHASASELFKHHCFRPVRFDSPLLSYIDEIILNLPYPPRLGGSEVPICDYARGIARFTHDNPEEMIVDTVSIPPLIGWSKRFQSIDLTSSEKNMGRKPKTTNWLESRGIGEYTEDMVYELFPLLRKKAPVKNQRMKMEDGFSVSVRKLKDRDRTAGYLGVLSRTTFDKHLTLKAKAKAQVLSDMNGKPKLTKVNIHNLSDTNTKLQRIAIIDTRPKHWIPKLKVEPTVSIPLPPQESDLSFTQIDLRSAQAFELKQLQTARMVLLDQIPKYSPLLELLDEFVKVLDTSIRSKKRNELLPSFSDFLAEHRHTREIWKRMSWFRNYLNGWNLPSDIHQSVEGFQTQDHRFLLHYGNYLVLLLSHIGTAHNYTQGEIKELWEMLRPWVVMQLGAKRRSSSLPRPMFDMPTMYEQLRSRTRFYQERVRPQTVPMNKVRYGITVDLQSKNPGRYRWYIFERDPFSEDVYMGCIQLEDVPSYSIRANTIIPLDELGRLAEFAKQKGEIHPIMIATHSGTDILYRGNDDVSYSQDFDFMGEEWTPVGSIRFGTRYRSAPARLRFVKVVNPGISYPAFDTDQRLPRRKNELSKRLFEQLTIIQSRVNETQRCRCTIVGGNETGKITITPIQKRFPPSIINYGSRSEGERLLMYPYVTGLPFKGGFTWDPLTDIDYQQHTGELETSVIAKIQLHKKGES